VSLWKRYDHDGFTGANIGQWTHSSEAAELVRRERHAPGTVYGRLVSSRSGKGVAGRWLSV
jgi:hypothetical protein